MNNSDIIIDSECDTEYDPLFENFIYLGTASYLILGLFLHIRILWTILIKERSYFKDNSFFILFAADSIASVSLILNDLLFTRVFMYIPQLCPIVSPFFWTPSIILKVIYFLNNHARLAKSVAQIFMVLNRMSCVIIPAVYNKIWSTLTPIACVLVVILPFGGLWNILISRIFVLSVRGGFGTSYIRAVSWASLSMFQSIYIITALIFTFVCTSITLYKLILLPGRIKSAEKSLCFTSITISVTFLLVAVTQVTFATCLSCRSDALYIIQFMAFDTFTVGSAVIMVLTNQHIRSSIFSSSRKRKIINVTVTAMPSGRFSNTS
ncbi:CRE-SRG-17 protein [Caenorhabditis remanei]|uniref:Serpentine receptor class gamma n=1 Tax=Caenorhabditis remanei TaxID=31234 RepID=E3M100_CAERE|nr:CRE-SRG-17 protein [Caenorhabditis remanei]